VASLQEDADCTHYAFPLLRDATIRTSAIHAGQRGFFRALRTIPVMLDGARDKERYCPGTPMVNCPIALVMRWCYHSAA
jgi:hypothetical protein